LKATNCAGAVVAVSKNKKKASLKPALTDVRLETIWSDRSAKFMALLELIFNGDFIGTSENMGKVTQA
jgi:hypothetical protein